MSGPFEHEDEQLDALGRRFLEALDRKRAGDVDGSEDELRAILKVEPRLAEPHMELARILLDTDRLSDAEIHAREGLQHLEAGGQWTDELPENVLKALAHALLAEVLRRRADEDDVIFGDPARFRELVDESRKHFALAAELDPSDEYASYHAFFLGLEGHGGQATSDDDDVFDDIEDGDEGDEGDET